MKLSFSPVGEMNKIFHSLNYIFKEEEKEELEQKVTC